MAPAKLKALVIVGSVRPASVASISTGRSTHLDVLRAIAALLVVGYHANGLVAASSGGGGLWLRNNVDTGVELFFVLSGYLIALPFLRALVAGDRAPDPHRYAWRRAARILPGYWLALGVAAFVAARQPGALPSVALLLPQVGLLQGVIPGDAAGPLVVAWTLSIEAAFYVGVPVATWVLLRRRSTWSIGSLAALTCVVWAISALLAFSCAAFVPADPWTSVVLHGPAGLMCQFCPGMLVALLQIRSERAGTSPATRTRAAWMLITGGAIGWVCVVAWAGPAASALHVVVRDLACGGVFGLVLLGTLRVHGAEHRLTRLFARVGTVSYGMYLWHWLVFEVIAAAGLRIGLTQLGLFDWVLATGLLAVATLPLAILSWQLVERPAILWASDRSRPRRLAAGTVVALPPPVGP
jgi:peptidoglycan/LPS O-acetylase OafA/YrhL